MAGTVEYVLVSDALSPDKRAQVVREVMDVSAQAHICETDTPARAPAGIKLRSGRARCHRCFGQAPPRPRPIRGVLHRGAGSMNCLIDRLASARCVASSIV